MQRALVRQVATSPVFWLSLVVSAALVWKRRALVASFRGTSAQVAKPATDRFAHSLRALILSLVTAAPLSLLLGAIGWQLQAAGQGTDLSHAVGLTLTRTALVLWGILALRAICLPSGLGIAHFHWPEPGVRRLGAELGWLIWVSVPAQLVAHLVIALNPAATGGVVTRLALLVATLGLAIFLYRVFHPKRGALAQTLKIDLSLSIKGCDHGCPASFKPFESHLILL